MRVGRSSGLPPACGEAVVLLPKKAQLKLGFFYDLRLSGLGRFRR